MDRRTYIGALLSASMVMSTGCSILEEKTDISFRLVNFRETEQTVQITFETEDGDTVYETAQTIDGVEEGTDSSEYNRTDTENIAGPGHYHVTTTVSDGATKQLDYRATCTEDDDLGNTVTLVIRGEEDVSLNGTHCG